MIDNTEFMRDGPASKNYNILYDPMGIWWKMNGLTIGVSWTILDDGRYKMYKKSEGHIV